MIGRRTEEEVLAFIDSHWEQNWASPPYEELGRFTGLKSKSSVSLHMHKLVDAGRLEMKGQGRLVLFRRVR